MNSEDIDITTDNPSTDDLSDPTSKPTTDDFDIFQGYVISYSQLLSQIILDQSAGTTSTQYTTHRASSYDTSGPSTRVSETQALVDARYKLPRREIQPKDTFNLSHIRRIFAQR
jgi:hypothetical protein